MTNVFIAGGAGGGASSDECTATAADVLKGKTYVGSDTDDEVGVGTLDVSDINLDGDATAGDVIKGKTFYSDNAASKRTGTLELTGNADTSFVAQGATFYTKDPKQKQVGTAPAHAYGQMKATGVGLTGGTSTPYDLNVNIPSGIYLDNYLSTGVTSRPARVRIAQQTMVDALGITSDKIITGESILGVDGTATSTLDGTAVASDVAEGKTFYNTGAGAKVTGTVPVKGNFSVSYPTATSQGFNFTVPKGLYRNDATATTYYTSMGIRDYKIVKGYSIGQISGAGVTEINGTATTGDVLSGKTFYSTDAETKQTGAIPTTNASLVSASGVATSGSGSTMRIGGTIPVGAYGTPSGNFTDGTVGVLLPRDKTVSTLGLYGYKIVSGYSIMGVSGTAEEAPSWSGTAGTGDVLSGKTFYSTSGTKRTGTITNRGTSVTASTASVNTDASLSIDVPTGYYPAAAAIKVTKSTLQSLIPNLASFSGSQTSQSQCTVTITGPKGFCSGAAICIKFGSAPTSASDGFVTRYTSSGAAFVDIPNATSHIGETLYVTAFPYIELNTSSGSQYIHGTKTSTISFRVKQFAFEKTFTANTVWTVPYGIRTIDIFGVGGGGAGGDYTPGVSFTGGCGGGGGGYTYNVWGQSVTEGQKITITIGAGGDFADGGSSWCGSSEFKGGKRGSVGSQTAGNGGSGGGAGSRSDKDTDWGKNGGTDGGDGDSSYSVESWRGIGQGYTTKPFDDANRTPYAGGGGGGSGATDYPRMGSGGNWGGGKGAWTSSSPAVNGTANSGGGGGGGGRSGQLGGADGGSGVIIIRANN